MAKYPNKHFDRLSFTFLDNVFLFTAAGELGWTHNKIENLEQESLELQPDWLLGADKDNILKE